MSHFDDEHGEFEEQRQRCAAELKGLLEDLLDRYPVFVVFGALAENVGAGLSAMMKIGKFTPGFVRKVVDFVGEMAFYKEGPQPTLFPRSSKSSGRGH